MAKKPTKLRSLFKISLVFSLTGFSFLISPPAANIYVNATSGEKFYVLEQSDGETQLNSMNLTTGALTSIGAPLENTLPGRISTSYQSTYDPVSHTLFYGIYNNGAYVVEQNTQNGAFTTVTVDNGFQYIWGADSSTGKFYALEQNNGVTQLNSMDLTTGALTPIGAPLENTLPGRISTSYQSTYDPVSHTLFYGINYLDPNFNNTNYVVEQNTQTGAFTKVQVDNGFQYIWGADSSTGKFYAVEQNNGETQLNSMDLTTGALTPIGAPLENTLPGRNSTSYQSTYDPVSHTIFYGVSNNGTSYVVEQNTQTGAFTKVQVDNGFQYIWGAETAANNPPAINTLSNATINKGSVYTANGSFTDSSSSSWSAIVDYGDGAGTNPLTLNGMNFALSHIYNSLGTYTITVKVTGDSGLTGTATTLITVVPSGGLAGANLGHTNYSGADFNGQDLSKANLTVATFNNVDFQSANLSQVNGSNSSFISDNFTGANLTKANLSNSNISGSNFTNANLTQANFSGATITGVTWSNTICPNGTNSNNDGGTCVGQGGGL